MDVAKLRVVIDGDSSGAEKALSSTSKSVQDTGKRMSVAGGVMTAAVSTPLAGLGMAAFNAASDLNESMSKVEVVFGDASTSIVEFSKTASSSLGMSQQQALEAVGTFGNLMSAMGMGTPQAADMSRSMVQLAADLASFNNASPEETLLALRSGLTGETEPLKRFGVNLNQARIEAEALRLGLAQAPVDMRKVELATNALNAAQADLATKQKSGRASAAELQAAQDKVTRAQLALEKAMEGGKVELDAAARAQAAYSLIMQDTSLAQGDFARTSDGAANQSRILTASFSDLAAQLGTQLLPIGLQVMGFVRGLIDRFKSLSPGVQKAVVVVGALVAAIGPLMTVVGGVTTAVGFLASPVGIVVAALAALAVAVVFLWKRSEKFREVVTRVWDSVKAAVKRAGELIQSVIASIGDWLDRHRDTVERLRRAFENAFTAIAGAVQGAVDIISGILSALQMFWDRWGNDLLNTVAGIFGGILNVIEGVFTAIKGVFDVFAGLFTLDFERMAKGITEIFGGLGRTILGILEALGAPLGFIMEIIEEEVVAPIRRAFNTVVDFVAGLPRRIADVAVGMWDGIKEAFRSALNWIIERWNGLEFKLPSFGGLHIGNQTVIPGWEGPTLGVPDIPPLAFGGITTGPTLAMIGDNPGGREAVIPLNPGNPGLVNLARAVADNMGGRPGPVNVRTDIVIHADGRDSATTWRAEIEPLLDKRDAALLRALRAR